MVDRVRIETEALKGIGPRFRAMNLGIAFAFQRIRWSRQAKRHPFLLLTRKKREGKMKIWIARFRRRRLDREFNQCALEI